jgi:tubulysin polyketide synthase-like protein
VSVVSLLEDLERLGVKVIAEGEWLRYSGPRAAITPEVLQRLKEHKTDILEQLGPSLHRDESASQSGANLANNAVTPRQRESLCHHGLCPDECACCSGFVRWVIKDESRMRLLLSSPDKARRKFRRLVKEGKA